MIKQFLHAVIWTKRHLSGQYDVDVMSIVARFIGSNETCLDIGAHAGSWTRPLSKLVKKGHVYAFEALPYYARVLQYTVTLLRLKNVTVFNYAIFDHNKTVKLIWRDKNGRRLTGETHIKGLVESEMDTVTVDSLTVDVFIASQKILSPVAFVKCDVEGAELMVVRGAVKTIERFRPIFYLEAESIHCSRYGYKADNLFDFFRLKQYDAYTLSGSNFYIVDKRLYSGKGNVLFIPFEKDLSR